MNIVGGIFETQAVEIPLNCVRREETERFNIFLPFFRDQNFQYVPPFLHDQNIQYFPPFFMIKIFNIFSLIFTCAHINYLTNLLIVSQIISMLFVSLSDHDQFIWSLPIPFNRRSFTHSDFYQHQQFDNEVQHVFDPLSAFGIRNNNLLLIS